MPKSMTLLLLAAFGSPLVVAAQPAQYGPPADDNVRLVYADVLRVDPIYDTVRVDQPREECYDTDVSRRGGRYENTTTGTIVGALIGGALGNQVGKGDGRKAATIAGAVAGGVIGNNAEKNQRSAPRFEIFVQMDDGRRLVVEQPTLDDLRDGDRVRLINGRAVLY